MDKNQNKRQNPKNFNNFRNQHKKPQNNKISSAGMWEHDLHAQHIEQEKEIESSSYIQQPTQFPKRNKNSSNNENINQDLRSNKKDYQQNNYNNYQKQNPTGKRNYQNDNRDKNNKDYKKNKQNNQNGYNRNFINTNSKKYSDNYQPDPYEQQQFYYQKNQPPQNQLYYINNNNNNNINNNNFNSINNNVQIPYNNQKKNKLFEFHINIQQINRNITIKFPLINIQAEEIEQEINRQLVDLQEGIQVLLKIELISKLMQTEQYKEQTQDFKNFMENLRDTQVEHYNQIKDNINFQETLQFYSEISHPQQMQIQSPLQNKNQKTTSSNQDTQTNILGIDLLNYNQNQNQNQNQFIQNFGNKNNYNNNKNNNQNQYNNTCSIQGHSKVQQPEENNTNNINKNSKNYNNSVQNQNQNESINILSKLNIKKNSASSQQQL